MHYEIKLHDKPFSARVPGNHYRSHIQVKTPQTIEVGYIDDEGNQIDSVEYGYKQPEKTYRRY